MGGDIAFRAGRARWTTARAVAVGSALVSFYVTYFAYRNLKSVVPLLRDENFDGRLADLDRSLFAGSDPADLLHSLLGSGVSAYALSGVYELFFVFIPVALAFALVVLAGPAGRPVPHHRARAQLGAGRRELLHAAVARARSTPTPADFAHLPVTGVSGLQEALLDARVEFLRDPSASGAAQSIGAFASLHVSIFFTAALATHLLGLGRFVKIGVWVLFALTVVATIYFGWHYVLDDLAGTGHRRRGARPGLGADRDRPANRPAAAAGEGVS